jgi:hypothetical protein
VGCPVRCRQARHRFTRAAGRAAAGAHNGPAGRLAYADPRYPGKAFHDRHQPDHAGEVDHTELNPRHAAARDASTMASHDDAWPIAGVRRVG